MITFKDSKKDFQDFAKQLSQSKRLGIVIWNQDKGEIIIDETKFTALELTQIRAIMNRLGYDEQ